MPQGPIIFDRQLVRARRRRALARAPVTFLVERVAEDFADRLAAVLRQFEVALDLGTPTDAVRRVLPPAQVATVIAPTPSPLAGAAGGPAVALDEEALAFRDASLDLVVSALALQYVNDLPGTLIQIRRALADGLFRRRSRVATRSPSSGSSPRPRLRSRTVSRRGSRCSPSCASSARCSRRVLRCRLRMSTASRCATPRRLR
jgi:hypothetical protein